jgi:hypothetical protein
MVATVVNSVQKDTDIETFGLQTPLEGRRRGGGEVGRMSVIVFLF